MEQAATPIYDELFKELTAGGVVTEDKPAAEADADLETSGRRHREAS
ncbi:hypothetical protein [Allokutzneria oryzae]|uniref:Uncharacterized protein n=1 Tax=Allokutzneria oryzae TaxID=1378989 RepID=A0ABV5ZV17_9PSEU